MAWRQALTRDAAISFQGEDHGVGSVPDTTAYYEEEEREADSDFEEYESNHTHVSRHLTSGALRNDVHSISKVAGSSARPPGGGGQVAPYSEGEVWAHLQTPRSLWPRFQASGLTALIP